MKLPRILITAMRSGAIVYYSIDKNNYMDQYNDIPE